MESKIEEHKKKGAAFNVQQALIGLELGETDEIVLKYFNFFAKKQPIESVFCLNVVPRLDLERALYEKETQSLVGDYTINSDAINKMELEVIPTLTSIDEMKIEYDVKEGDPLEKILDASANDVVDLLVIGNAQGILAKNLVRSAHTNTLIVPKNAKMELSNILVPVDFSASSIKALETALAMHKNLGSFSSITAIHIYSMPTMNHFKEDLEWKLVRERVEESLKKGFEAFLHTNVKHGKDLVKFECIERTGPGTAHFILDYATQNDTDLIITGAKGHSKVHHMMMGSVTEEIIDHSQDIAFMVVR